MDPLLLISNASPKISYRNKTTQLIWDGRNIFNTIFFQSFIWMACGRFLRASRPPWKPSILHFFFFALCVHACVFIDKLIRKLIIKPKISLKRMDNLLINSKICNHFRPFLIYSYYVQHLEFPFQVGCLVFSNKKTLNTIY